MTDFQLHPQLAADCHQLGQLEGALLLLHKNAEIPWFILVPQTEQVDFLLLPSAEQARLLDTASKLGEFLLNQMQCQRTNFAAIGNLVPQMHLHVVGRTQDDCCWPAPVWGNLTSSAEYSTQQRAQYIEQLQALLPDLVPLRQ